jgi:hypothetical protein
LIDEALRRAFDNDLARIEQPATRATRAPHRPIPAAEVAAEADRIEKLALLDFIMPNGKALRDCSGAECRAAGGWLTAIADRIGDNAIVGAKLGEAAARRDEAGRPRMPTPHLCPPTPHRALGLHVRVGIDRGHLRYADERRTKAR